MPSLTSMSLSTSNQISPTFSNAVNSTTTSLQVTAPCKYADIAQYQLTPDYINVYGNLINNNKNSGGIYINTSKHNERISVKCTDNYIKGSRYVPINVIGAQISYVCNNIVNGSTGSYLGISINGLSNKKELNTIAYVHNNIILNISGSTDKSGNAHNIKINNYYNVFSINNTATPLNSIDYGNCKNVFETRTFIDPR